MADDHASGLYLLAILYDIMELVLNTHNHFRVIEVATKIVRRSDILVTNIKMVSIS